ncbi:hypothetical protein BpHYR1_045443 [Brachionus plicatilis]|uniref:Protein kinase domain-containing protein n=1 Tax=Brachionus plicatilis TaxID=10195 RepID=A0A3M7PD88_BRAPC|nr:hypothetical protein BpHYR1_045443 [Brachionus plicatilis]
MPSEFYEYSAAITKPNTIDLQKIDIYTYGLTLLEIFYGKHGALNEEEDFSIRNPIVVKIKSKYFGDLINKCIDKVSSRPTALVVFEYLIKLNDSLTKVEKIEMIDEAYLKWLIFKIDK